ncbi:putative DNA binding protein [Planoprotostelium fungivorum]|uniref:Putative DNA binding protein n=1 Tax=Planoprotostelium fungivorum TaxID=1890364 RepID=A0A2P6NIG6_9EUKA|nr:putative DNA binding protein [Planoprotostelium fungivorum]
MSISTRKPDGDPKIQGTPFVTKTYMLVSDPANQETVVWSDRGDSFIVKRPVEFSAEILPKYFKHNNFCSFIRQLNTYGFTKLDSKLWEFQHEFFNQTQPQLLKNISRRKSKKRDQERGGLDPDSEELESVLKHYHESQKTNDGKDNNYNEPPQLAPPPPQMTSILAPQQDWSSMLLGMNSTPDFLEKEESDADVIFRSQMGDQKRNRGGRDGTLNSYGSVDSDLGFAQVLLSPKSALSSSPVHTPSSSFEYDSTPISNVGPYTPSDSAVVGLQAEIKKLSDKHSQTQETILKILHEMMESRREQSNLEKKVAQLSEDLLRLQTNNGRQRNSMNNDLFMNVSTSEDHVTLMIDDE